jgi:Na+/melibiose symporter-like transporter
MDMAPATAQGWLQLFGMLYLPLLVVLVVYKALIYRSHRWGWRAFMLVAFIISALLLPFSFGTRREYLPWAAAAALVLLPLAEGLIVRRALRRLHS